MVGMSCPGNRRQAQTQGDFSALQLQAGPRLPGGCAPPCQRGSEVNTQESGEEFGTTCSQQKPTRLSGALLTVDPVRL